MGILYHSILDMTSQTILPEMHARALYLYSHLWFLNALYGLYIAQTIHSLIPFGVGCTSLLYWGKHQYDWRRKLDMSMCIFSSVYVTYHLIDSPQWNTYLFIKALGYLAYFSSVYYHMQRQYTISTILHMGTHLSAHTGAIILFNYVRQ
jgi:hypothetical protein